MESLATLKDKLISAINEQVLPGFNRDLSLTGLICYGSRVTGKARKNSDIDMMAVVEAADGAEFYGEFHGTLPLEGPATPVEIRIYSSDRVQQLLGSEDAKKFSALQQSYIVFDHKNELQVFKEAAAEKFTEIVRGFGEELFALKSEEILPILQITASEQHKIFQHLLHSKQNLAALYCVTEFLVDYMVCVESCLKDSSKENCLSNLYFLHSDKGGRFLNLEKYTWPKRYDDLIRSFNESLSSPQAIDSAFTIFDRHFNGLFKQDLLLPEDKWPSVRMN